MSCMSIRLDRATQLDIAWPRRLADGRRSLLVIQYAALESGGISNEALECRVVRVACCWLRVRGLLLRRARAAPAATANAAASEHARIVAYWTPARRAAAIPRDLVKDARGQGYLRRPDGSLIPYGWLIADKSAATPAAASTGPTTVNNVDPAAGATIGASYTFKATVTDVDGIRSVSFKIQKSGSTAQSFNSSSAATSGRSRSPASRMETGAGGWSPRTRRT